MKKVVFILCIACAFVLGSTEKSSAQFAKYTLSKTSTSSATDTITGTLTMPASLVSSAVITMTPASGTGGRLVIMGSQKGNTWVRLDSVTVNLLGAAGAAAGKTDYHFNRVTSPTKFPGVPDFYLYRFIWYQTSGSVTGAEASNLIRSNPK
jgi:hypothetical protein